MASISPSDLITLLRGYRLRVRTGLRLLPAQLFGQEPDEAAVGDRCRRSSEAVTGRTAGKHVLQRPQRRLCDRTAETKSAARNQGSDCLLVYNFDLLLARLRHDERSEVWHLLY